MPIKYLILFLFGLVFLAGCSQPEKLSFEGAFQKLLQQDKDLVCEWNFADAKGYTPSQGKIYVSGNKYLNQAKSGLPQDNDSGYFNRLYDGKTVYIWQDGSKKGSRIDSPMGGEGIDTNQENQYKFICQKWEVDNAKFQPPEEVNFFHPPKQQQESAN